MRHGDARGKGQPREGFATIGYLILRRWQLHRAAARWERERAPATWAGCNLHGFEIEQGHGEVELLHVPPQEPLDRDVECLPRPNGAFRQLQRQAHVRGSREFLSGELGCLSDRRDVVLLDGERRNVVLPWRCRQHPPAIDESDLAPVGAAAIDNLNARRDIGRDAEIGGLGTGDDEFRRRRRGFLLEPLGREGQHKWQAGVDLLALGGEFCCGSTGGRG